MFYHHRFMFGSIDSASACAESSFIRRRRRRVPSALGFRRGGGAVEFSSAGSVQRAGPGPRSRTRTQSSRASCVPSSRRARSWPRQRAATCRLRRPRSPASRLLLTVLGSDVRLEDLPGLPEQQEDLVLPQAPEGTAASGGGLFGLSWPVVALVGGGGLLAVAVIASGGSDSDDGGGGTSGERRPAAAAEP